MDLLATKFYMPPPRRGLVERPHLLQRLDEALQPGRPLILVSAPAGYGKTTLIAGWLRQANTLPGSGQRPRSAWLSLDENDNDLVRFFAYLVAALQESGVTLGQRVERLCQLSPLPPLPTLATALLNEINEVVAERPLLLVLDDYHKIAEPRIHEAVQFMLDHAPLDLHLALMTREDPPLTLSRWRVRHQMTEIRGSDLRFSGAEAAGFLNETMGLSLTAGDVAALEQRTEGWIAGLQLAALALQARDAARDNQEVGAFIAAFGGSHHYVIDYLLEEVLRLQEPDVRDFLHQTAILDRFNPSLCDAVTGRSDSGAILAYLERNNLFLVPLDDQRQWYRYHQLLADSLSAGQPPAEQREGHRRATAWYHAQGLYPEAIAHAAAAKDSEEVARLVRLAAEPAFANGEISQLAAWLALLPKDAVTSDLTLGVFWLLSLILTGRSQEAPAALAALEQNAASGNSSRDHARLQVIKCWLADIMGNPERVALARKAAAALPEDDTLFRPFVAVPLGHAYLYQGDVQGAIRVFREGIALTQAWGTTFVRLSLLGNLIHALNHAGRRQESLTLCEQTVAGYVDTQGNPLPAAGLPYLLRAWLHYDANELEQARQDLRLAGELMRQAVQETMLTPLEFELPFQLHLAAGSGEQAEAARRAGHERASAQQYEHGMLSAARIEAELQLRRGEIAAVRRWAEASVAAGAGNAAGGEPQAVNDMGTLTYTRLLLAEEQRDEASAVLARLTASARAGERGRSLILMLLLQALVGEQPSPYLEEALQRASAGGYLRLILDECTYPVHGPALQQLLLQATARQSAPAFVDRLHAALADGEGPEAVPVPATATRRELREPLTEQELVIVRLLAAGLSNRQIADELVISIGTTKWHVHNIYQKLGVSGRAEAVARIHEWQLIDR